MLYHEGISPQTIQRLEREKQLQENFLLVTECDFCGMREGEKYYSTPSIKVTKVFIYRNHYEEHLANPRKVNICVGCHAILHSIHRVQLNQK